jgi:hypothetical protein
MKNTKPNIEAIKKAIFKNCGGFQDATDGQLLSKWNSLPENLKEQYLNNAKGTDNVISG